MGNHIPQGNDGSIFTIPDGLPEPLLSVQYYHRENIKSDPAFVTNFIQVLSAINQLSEVDRAGDEVPVPVAVIVIAVYREKLTCIRQHGHRHGRILSAI